MAEYESNPKAQEIATQLIPEHHPEIAKAEILYLFTDKTVKRRGKVQLARTMKASDLIDHLSGGADFVIVFSSEPWGALDEEQRIALVDHQLCYCDMKTDKDGNDGFTLRAADFEGFTGNVERHGLWNKDVADFVNMTKQLKLPMDPGTVKRRRADGEGQHLDA